MLQLQQEWVRILGVLSPRGGLVQQYLLLKYRRLKIDGVHCDMDVTNVVLGDLALFPWVEQLATSEQPASKTHY